ESSDLAEVAWFAPLSEAARQAVSRHADRIDIRTRTRLQHEGSRVRWLWVVVDGVVEVRQHGELLGLITPGHAFGEVELLLGRPSPVEVIATGSARVVSVPAAAFHGLFHDPSFAATVAGARIRPATTTTPPR